ncbi:MAG TPA: (deoxy)nucleoside triphosphate pyrophosphohydrolase [Anaeromyxobacter sp.]
MSNRLRVVAAVVRRGGAILITRRPDRPGRPGQWEFPGGKVEPGEPEIDALRRELREELGCEAVVGPLLLRHAHRYPDLEVDLAFYSCTLPAAPELRPIGVAEIAWAEVGTLSSYDFLEGDRAVLAEIERLA